MLHICTYTYSVLHAFKIFIFWIGFRLNGKTSLKCRLWFRGFRDLPAGLLTAASPAPNQGPTLTLRPPPMAPYSLMASASVLGIPDGQPAAPGR